MPAWRFSSALLPIIARPFCGKPLNMFQYMYFLSTVGILTHYGNNCLRSVKGANSCMHGIADKFIWDSACHCLFLVVLSLSPLQLLCSESKQSCTFCRMKLLEQRLSCGQEYHECVLPSSLQKTCHAWVGTLGVYPFSNNSWVFLGHIRSPSITSTHEWSRQWKSRCSS